MFPCMFFCVQNETIFAWLFRNFECSAMDVEINSNNVSCRLHMSVPCQTIVDPGAQLYLRGQSVCMSQDRDASS